MEEDISYAGFGQGSLEKIFMVWWCCNHIGAKTNGKGGTETIDIKEEM